MNKTIIMFLLVAAVLIAPVLAENATNTTENQCFENDIGTPKVWYNGVEYYDDCIGAEILLQYTCNLVTDEMMVRNVTCEFGCDEEKNECMPEETGCFENDVGTHKVWYNGEEYFDECLDGNIYKAYSCDDNDELIATPIECEEGCNDDGCIDVAEHTCFENDLGNTPSVLYDDVEYFDYCDNDVKVAYHCDADDKLIEEKTHCPDGCNGIHCLEEPKQCNETTINGKAGVIYDGKELVNGCENDNVYVEYECGEQGLIEDKTYCPYDCGESGCLAEEEDDLRNRSQKKPRTVADDKPEQAQPVVTGAQQARNETQAKNQTQERNQTGWMMEVNGSQVHAGLYNALQNVENENARAALERNMERFLDRYQNRIQNMTVVDVDVDEETGATEIKAKEQVKYLGFIKGKATKRFEIQNNGQVTEKQPWFRFLYKDENK